MTNLIKETLNNFDNGDVSTMEQDSSYNILQTVIDNVPELIFYKDKEGRYRGANKQCLNFYESLGVTDLIGKTDLELPLDRSFVETCTKHDLIVIETKEPLFIEEEAQNADGSIQIFETVKTPVINNHNELWGIVGVVRDITTRKLEEKKLRYLSYTDTLTGLYNRAYFDEVFNKLISQNNFPIGIILGDLNGLKLINDTFGHIEGDNVLINISKILKSLCNNNIQVFRWGGDEFIILVPNCLDDNCERLMQNITANINNNEKNNFKLSLSMGSCIISDNSTTLDDALKEAENKLYRQKLLDNKSTRSSVLSTLKNTLQVKNLETEEHTERVLKYSLEIGKKLNLKKDTLDELALVAKLHDIGKIGIPENILMKPSRLTAEEYEIMKTHSERGYRLALMLPELSHIARKILTHHEKWDGTGYPLGLSGTDIPLISRIVAVVDSYDAMTNNRVYNIVKTKDEAIAELKRCSGTQFEPNIVDIFCKIIQ